MPTFNEPKRTQYSVELSFRYYQNYVKRDSLRILDQVFESENLQPAIQSTPGNIIAKPLKEILERNYVDYAENEEISRYMLRTVGFPILIQNQSLHNVWCSFGWSVFKDGRIVIDLIAGVFAVPGEHHKAHSALATIFQSFAAKLYDATHPINGYVLDSDADSRAWSRVGTPKLKLVTLTWLNYWGPEMVEKYDREILSNIPGYSIEHLADGGILYQSRPTIAIGNEIAHRRWQKDVIKYLSSHDIKITFEKD